MKVRLSLAMVVALAVSAFVTAGYAPVVESGEEPQQQQRLIRMVELLESGQVVFGSSVGDRSPDGAVQMARNSDIDFFFYDMEHAGFDLNQLRTFMQFTLDPAHILARGRPGTDHAILIRIPPFGRELKMNQWVIKNLLDQGIHGTIAPFIETAEQAEDLIRAMRYPQSPDAANPGPVGQRGSGAGTAIRFWGVGGSEYRARSDLWGLSPQGELLTMLLIENELGVQNIREIVQVPGVSMVMAATGDLGSYYNGDAEKVERDVQTILAACKEFDVACAIPTGVDDTERRIREGFRVILTSGEALRIGRQVAGRTSP